jgi:hypothetical protein
MRGSVSQTIGGEIYTPHVQLFDLKLLWSSTFLLNNGLNLPITVPQDPPEVALVIIG